MAKIREPIPQNRLEEGFLWREWLTELGDTAGTVTSVSVATSQGFSGTVATETTDAVLTLGTTVDGMVKGDATSLLVAVPAVDYVAPSAYASANGLTMATARLLGRTTASTGAAEEITVGSGLTLSAGTLTATGASITIKDEGSTLTATPTVMDFVGAGVVATTVGNVVTVTINGGVAGGTVTNVTGVNANGLAWSIATPTTTPALTLSTTVTGLVKGNGTAFSAATSGTDYSLGTSALATGILKSTTGTGALTIAVAGDFPTLNQNTTGSSASCTGNAANVTGTVAIANGGTGLTTLGTAFQVLQVNAGATALQYVTLAGGGDALTANPLSQFAATTSAQLAGVISDETGSGALVFASSPTLVTPNLGTPSTLVGTNITGTAAGLTAGTASAVAVGGITGLGTGVATALAVNVGSAGAVVINGGALGTPSSGTATNLTGTATALNIGGNAATATTAGTVTTAAQTAITSVGTLTGLTVSGTTTINTGITGLVKATAGVLSQATSGVDYLATGPVTSSGLTQTTNRILGRTTAGTGAIEEITLSGAFTFTGGSLGITVGAGAGTFQDVYNNSVGADFVTFITPTNSSKPIKIVDSGISIASETKGSLQVYSLPAADTAGSAIYSVVNCGGGALPSVMASPDWAAVTGATYRGSGTGNSVLGGLFQTWIASVETGAGYTQVTAVELDCNNNGSSYNGAEAGIGALINTGGSYAPWAGIQIKCVGVAKWLNGLVIHPESVSNTAIAVSPIADYTLASPYWMVSPTGVMKIGDGSGVPAVTFTPTSASALTIAGTVTFSSTISGNVSGSSGSCTGNAATATSAITAGTVTTAAQPTITSVGTLSSLTVSTPISGSVTGSAASCTGNAATATTLQTARTINGQSFNGSANITIPGSSITGIPNASLTNSSLTIGSTAISLGSSSTTLAGLTSVTSTSFVGTLTGSASTAATVTTAAQPAITSVGTLTSLTSSGAITITVAGAPLVISSNTYIANLNAEYVSGVKLTNVTTGAFTAGFSGTNKPGSGNQANCQWATVSNTGGIIGYIPIWAP